MNKVLVLALSLAGLGLSAQSIGTSPYASFGIGDVKYDQSIDIASMGGISAAYVPDYANSFNFSNPAANFNLDLSSVRVQFSNENVRYKSDFNDYKKTKHSNYFSGISIAFPLSTNLKFGMSYQPYSSKSYENQNSSKLPDETSQISAFKGDGTVSRVEGALSYHITKGLGVGFKTSFDFGSLSDLQEITFSDAELISGFETKNRIKSFKFTGGVVYQQPMKIDHLFTVGAAYQFGNGGEMRNSFINSTYFRAPDGSKQNESIIQRQSINVKNMIPDQLQAGVGYGREGRWFASAQVDLKKSQDVAVPNTLYTYKDGMKATLGGWFIPNVNDFRSLLNRTTYRYGVFYDKTGLNVLGTDIKAYGLSLGASIPIKPTSTSASTLDLGLEFGKRGNTKNNLISEGFFNFKVGINFANRWFIKRVYD